jgi:uncharacterized membrane protein YccF (DUF307 family)
MRRSFTIDRLKQIGAAIFLAVVWGLFAGRLWMAVSTGHIERRSQVYDRVLNPGLFWFETILSLIIVVSISVGVTAWAIYKLAGAMGWRGLSVSEKLARPATPSDVARRRDAENHDMR